MRVVFADGQQVETQTFSNAASANAFFTNDSIDLGKLATLAGDSTLDLTIRLTTGSNQANSGYEAQFVVGTSDAHAASASMDHAMQFAAFHEASFVRSATAAMPDGIVA